MNDALALRRSEQPARMTLVLAFAVVYAFASPALQAADSSQVSKAAGETWEAIKHYSAEQRDEALQASGTAIQNLDRRIEALEAQGDAKWDEMSVSARDKWRSALRSLRKQRTELAEWYAALKHSSSTSWDGVKDAFYASFNGLRDRLRSLTNE